MLMKPGKLVQTFTWLVFMCKNCATALELAIVMIYAIVEL